ncbi:rhodanese-like domain-containing protein [Haloferula sargassicola]|uniref:Rhodanese domain-containing protein n=1 Tax=Haloferula sargassicola TaxID=490096 RepID=A0ABP9UQE2_9BACT
MSARSLFLLLLALAPAPALAGKLTAAQLAAILAQPAPHPVLIDIRPTAQYLQGSLPGAINIPGRVLLQKNMRFAHGCVLISDGISDKVNPAELAASLGQKGVSPADYLDGGMAAWSTYSDAAANSQPGAATVRGPESITYDDLIKLTGKTCLVDLRTAAERVVPKGHVSPLQELCTERKFTYFPDLESFHAAFRNPAAAAGAGTPPLVVLVGGEDTELPETEVEKLYLEGFHRSTVLLGGADIIANEGKRGLERQAGKTLTLPEPTAPNP